MSDFPSFPTDTEPFGANPTPGVSTGPEPKKTRGPRRGTTTIRVDTEGGGGGGDPASASGPVKRKGRPPKEQRDTVVAPRTGSPYLIELLPHLVGLQEAHIKPLTRAYHILSELPAGDRRRVAAILARVFA